MLSWLQRGVQDPVAEEGRAQRDLVAEEGWRREGGVGCCRLDGCRRREAESARCRVRGAGSKPGSGEDAEQGRWQGCWCAGCKARAQGADSGRWGEGIWCGSRGGFGAAAG
ncbi:hypothetical protein SLEP1_g28748 [Rubroshorea leprosula]|uniref:Uncharacterized protein n=1 Tax=Rubroshorea leprosula TaxID=152421 RepID=A0AAV5K451_9ROSI|nr:hypothetical protein SLEP1_g28748 [Rubroshorea leprosula]